MKLARNLLHFVVVHRRHRGAAAGRGGRARPRRRWAGWSGTPTRSPAGRARSCTGDDHGAGSRRTTSGSGCSSHVRALGEKDLGFADRAGRRASGSTYPSRGWRSTRLGPGLGLPRRRDGARMTEVEDRHDRRDGASAGWRRWSEVYGWDVPGRAGRLLPLHRRPPLRRHLEPAGPRHPRPAAAADRHARGPGRRRRARDPARRRRTATASSTPRRCARSWSSSPTTPAGRSGARLNMVVEGMIGKHSG